MDKKLDLEYLNTKNFFTGNVGWEFPVNFKSVLTLMPFLFHSARL